MIKSFHPFRTISRFSLLLSLLLAGQVQAKYSQVFHNHQINLDFNVTQAVVIANVLPQTGKELIVVGSNDQQERVLAVYGFDAQDQQFILQDKQIVAPRFFAYDLGDMQENGLQSLYLLDKEAVLEYVPAQPSEPAKWQKVQSVSSMYLGEQADVLKQKDFVKDVNNDKIDDLILPGFEQLNLWLSKCCSTRHAQSLPIAARIEVNESSVSYDDKDLYFQDMNLDGKTDLVIVEHGELQVYLQNQQQQFSPTAQKVVIDDAIHPLNWWDMKGPNGQPLDQSNLQHKVVRKIADFNGDGIADIAVQFTKSSGVLDKVIDFEFYFGSLNDTELAYNAQPDTRVTSDETLNAPQFFDRESDNKQELLVSAFDIGISQIIGALLSGSIDQNVLIYAMDVNQQFTDKPMLSQEVQMTFNLTSGTQGEPLVKMLDVNADGVKDLVFSDDDDEIRVLLATPKAKKAYAKRPLRQKVSLPKNPYDAATDDINGDGKADLVLHYGRADSEKLLKQLTVLIAK